MQRLPDCWTGINEGTCEQRGSRNARMGDEGAMEADMGHS